MTGSWVPGARAGEPSGGFGLGHLPYGAVVPPGAAAGEARLGVAIGDRVVDLAALASLGYLDGVVEHAVMVAAAPGLNPLLALGKPTWDALRARLTDLLSDADRTLRDAGHADAVLWTRRNVSVALPFAVGDYVDFYSSVHHATNVGRMFRPGGAPLLDNWHHLPVAYHGRAGTVVVSGTEIVRPRGQRRPPGADAPTTGPSGRLDFELELGFVTGDGPPLGTAVSVDRAEDHIFGVMLVNDWSARDLQAFEYQPLGPFLAKSFATSIAGWVTPLAALAPFRTAPPAPPDGVERQPYLRLADRAHAAIDLRLAVDLRPAGAAAPIRLSAVNFATMSWTMAEQLAHATVNGATIRAGDLFASGTVSGPTPGERGSLLELSWNGTKPLELPGGARRTFLEDGDEVTLTGEAGRDPSGDHPLVTLAPVTGTVVGAR